MSTEKAEEPQLVCARCNEPMTLGKVTVEYLGNPFPVELLRCPKCGLVFVPEDLAIGKMQQVECALEEK